MFVSAWFLYTQPDKTHDPDETHYPWNYLSAVPACIVLEDPGACRCASSGVCCEDIPTGSASDSGVVLAGVERHTVSQPYT